MTFWYLATPYTSHPDGPEAAYVFACEQAAVLMAANVPVFCPIAHGHGPAIHGGLPLTHDFWMKVDRPFMRAAFGLIICMGPGWNVSDGIAKEEQLFEDHDKPVLYMKPGVVPPMGELGC